MPFLAVNNDVTRRDWNFVPVHESERIVRKTEEKVKTAFDDIYIYIYRLHKHDCRYIRSCMTPSTNGNDEKERKKKNVKGREDGVGPRMVNFSLLPDAFSTWEKMTGALAYEIEIRLPIENRPIHFLRVGDEFRKCFSKLFENIEKFRNFLPDETPRRCCYLIKVC